MGTLFVVATPIGNLEDITLRALRTLKEVDLIACEDTRRTRILLDRYEIRTPLVSYHQHSKLQKIDWLVEQLAAGRSIALVSDAGTPGINDPGGSLIAAVIKRNYELGIKNNGTEEGILVAPIPGPNAAVTLLSVSGLPVDQYLFLGYLPKKKGRQTLLRSLAKIQDFPPQRDPPPIGGVAKFKIPFFFYESPERLLRTLTDLHVALGDRKIVIGRELTKHFEEIWRGTLTESVAYWTRHRPRGEFVLLVNPRS